MSLINSRQRTLLTDGFEISESCEPTPAEPLAQRDSVPQETERAEQATQDTVATAREEAELDAQTTLDETNEASAGTASEVTHV